MASIPLPALASQPPPSAMDQMSKLLQMKSLLNAQSLFPGQQQEQQNTLQSQQQENQMRQMQLEDQQTIQKIAPQYVQKDDSGKVTGYDFDGLTNGAIAAGVRPQSLAQLQTMRKNAADTLLAQSQANENLLKNQNTLNDQFRGHLESVRSAAPADRQGIYQQALDWAQGQKIDTSHLPPSNQLPTDDATLNPLLTGYETRLAMGSQLSKEAQEKAETAKNAAEAALTNLKVNGLQASPQDIHTAVANVVPANWADPSLAGRTEAQMNFAKAHGDLEGMQSALARASEEVGSIKKETNPAVIQARAQQAAVTASVVEPLRMQITQQFANQKDARDKIESTVLKPFQDKMNDLGMMNSAIDQAQQGNIAAARAALYKLIGVAQPTGSHRVLPTEVEGFSGMGGIPTRVRSSIANALSGDPWTPQMVEDIKSFGQAQSRVAQDSLNRGIDNANKLYNTNVGAGLKQQPQTQPNAAPKFQVGQMVTLKSGKQVKVTAVHPDGTFDAQ